MNLEKDLMDEKNKTEADKENVRLLTDALLSGWRLLGKSFNSGQLFYYFTGVFLAIALSVIVAGILVLPFLAVVPSHLVTSFAAGAIFTPVLVAILRNLFSDD